ncbi:MAG TPA: chemotaxis protein CheW [Mobilitalea sp.]|nr:chemotaxis protein CheW [Mobilitalea sp.]
MEKDVLFGGVPSEVEILEFKAGGNSYGMNVSDVKEILSYSNKPTLIPNSHPFIEGIIMPRDFIIPIINFISSLKLKDIDEEKNEMLIVTEINDQNIAIHVDSVVGIYRVMNTDISKPGKKLSTSQKDYVIGILNREDRHVEIVELRKIIKDINPEVNVG